MARSPNIDLLFQWQQENPPHGLAMQGKSVLVLGASGLVGVCVVDAWLRAGAAVTAVSREAQDALPNSTLTWLQRDLGDAKAWSGVRVPEIVVSATGIWSMTHAVSALARAGMTRLIQFSSTSAVTKADSANPKERALSDTLLSSEDVLQRACKEHGVALTILRPTLIYGIGLDYNVTSLAQMMRRLPVPFFPVPLNANGLRQPVHACDLAQATIDAAEKPATFGRTYNIGGAERLGYRAMLERIAAGVERKVWFVPVPFLALAGDVASHALRRTYYNFGGVVRRMGKDMVFDDQSARDDFGWSPRGFLDASRQPANTRFF